jgi:anti-anti-sigma factor
MTPLDSLSITVNEDAGIRLVSLRGSAGTEHAEELVQKLRELAVSSGCLVLDLSGLTFVNSAGLGAIIGAYRQCREQGGALCLVCPVPAVAQVLRITHLDRLIAVYPDVESARRALTPAKPT